MRISRHALLTMVHYNGILFVIRQAECGGYYIDSAAFGVRGSDFYYFDTVDAALHFVECEIGD